MLKRRGAGLHDWDQIALFNSVIIYNTIIQEMYVQ